MQGTVRARSTVRGSGIKPEPEKPAEEQK